jgi:uncharacterized protein YjaG (DUF416 family)
MTVHYDENELQTRLSSMDHRGLVLFGLYVAEQLLPNYRVFSREQSFGDVDTLRKAINSAWDWLDGKLIDNEEVESMIDACESVTPDTEDFNSLYVSAALDAANSIANVLRLLLDSDSELAFEIGTFGRDTVDLYVQEIERMPANSVDLEERIRLHPLMQREIAGQFDAMNAIENGISTSEARRLWSLKERSNLDLA